MDEVMKTEGHLTSPAAFVEGGIQDACDDSCSICLEAFCESDPSTVTSCNHEFHLQCVLEWCQRSSNCPMCWQSISLKDQMSQELFEVVEQERNFRVNAERNATLLHLPALGDFGLQHLPVDIDDPELEERILQHLAAAVSMGRAHHAGRREGSRNRSSTNDHPQFFHPNSSPTTSVSPSHTGISSDLAAATIADSSLPITPGNSESAQHTPHLSSVQSNQLSASSSRSVLNPATIQGISIGDRHSSSSSLTPSQGKAGPSDLQSLSESWKSRFNSLSMKYKESISKNTRGWKERLFSRSSSMPDVGSGRSEANAGIASLSRLMERLETRENSRAGSVSAVTNMVDSSHTLQRDHGNMGTHIGNGLNRNSTASAASSARN
ncbi:E3 ubiquitin-protein ligase RHF2A-like [Nicotiana sylvestris]|uniref:RING-type E3 ubiquitin transferase n=2 Tax=Nicotiana TaxID=4085 RepID=A0A1S3YAG9_TOBAC|nr:PREDICTED: E3 ubiquitin-protein ligase RHF2A-like [Nicotiana sylvestris]XP_009801358.1 PREDICTED: E3 ubiquitin-protein ligase RHF2A-like [Nicotiana sylvestris]XP_016449209.1 PREDICTED: E3 ubiquitin-protein ligase RHF2A-like [Nicotiana tabacum]XP_016449210.1 PREDICTED: E3 ubiquitin-protein ligase RHF2A-like [Nicotiana tabacum]